MIFCEACFQDEEIKSIIRSASIMAKGECPTCHHKNVQLYDSSKQMDLTPYFEDLLNVYTPVSSLPDSYPRAECRNLIDELLSRWKIFSDKVSRTQIDGILHAICSETLMNVPSLMNEMVGIPELYDVEYLKDHALLKNNDWDAFVNEIKTKNRFHSKLINFDILERYCTFIRKTYKAGHCFYRARISENCGYPPNEMSAPPPGKSSEGRANARGITCLYLASDQDTTLHEVRAGVFDFVSIGKFQLKRDITVANLRAISKLSPFIENLDCLDHAINLQHLEKINSEMSKSLRRSDSTLDYVPTQYIVDFIKSIEHDSKQEYDGIEYYSTTNPSGYNLAIFDPELFECISVETYNIKKLDYSKVMVECD